MNKKIINIISVMCLSMMFFMTSCNSITEELTSLTTGRLFRPVNFAYTNVKTKFTFTWVATQYAESYTLQVSTDSAKFSTLALDTTLTSLTYTQEFQGATQFYARIRANKSDTTKTKISQFNQISFRTPAENLFLGYGTSNNTGTPYSAFMTDVKTLTVKWQPAANTTHLILTSADGKLRDSVALSSDEVTKGVKNISSLANSNWQVQLYNNKILRGTTYGLVEGDVIISTGGDISAAVTNATAGQVILLAGGQNYTFGNTEYKFNKNIKIRSASPSSRSVISMTTLTGTTPPSATSVMMSVVASSVLDSLVFENIDFTGYCDNNTASTKIGYLFSNKVAGTVGNLKFTNCNIHNLGNTTFRISGGVNQDFKNLSFNGCTIYEIGYTSTYALVNSNSADLVDNINFTNCTIYNFKGSLILRTGSTINSINISNCTINQATQDAGSARYMFDLNTTTFASGFTIKNSIFGSSGGALGANGFRGTLAPTITGSYFTADYVDDPIPAGLTSTSIKSKMTSYSGTSTSLWNGPTTGDFTLKDTAFKGKGVAGDLRYY